MTLSSINLFTAAVVNTSAFLQELAKIAYEIVSPFTKFSLCVEATNPIFTFLTLTQVYFKQP